MHGFEFLGRGPRVSGSDRGWSRSPDIVYRCVTCGDSMPATQNDYYECTCKAMFVDRDYHRFGSVHGDCNVLVYRRSGAG